MIGSPAYTTNLHKIKNKEKLQEELQQNLLTRFVLTSPTYEKEIMVAYGKEDGISDMIDAVTETRRWLAVDRES